MTEGKLDICSSADIEAYLSSAAQVVAVRDAAQDSEARQEVKRFCRENGLNGEDLARFVMAVGEATTNAIKHAGQGRVYTGTLDESVWVGVSDDGPGIESLVLPRAVFVSGYLTRPSLGLGYTMMLDAADHILLKTDNHGTSVILVKNLAGTAPVVSLEDLPDTWDSIPA